MIRESLPDGQDSPNDLLADLRRHLDGMAARAARERLSHIEDQLAEAMRLQDPRMLGRLHKVDQPGDELLRVASSTDLGWWCR